MSNRTEILFVELRAIIDSDREHPLIERKAWLNLTDDAVRAKAARHLCALCNSGGGWLILGAADEGGLCESNAELEATSTQDAINDIVAKYLDPPFHCERHIVAWDDHLRVCHAYRVPPHGATPVCAKRDGPHKSGKPQGISTATHYVRSTKPASVPIVSSSDWKPLIDRCVTHQREELIASISGLLSGASEVEDIDALAEFADWSLNKWSEAQPVTEWTTAAKQNHSALTFRLLSKHEDTIKPISIGSIRTARESARDRSNNETGNMFVSSFELNAGSPSPASIRIFNGSEVIVRNHVHNDGEYFGQPYIWALSPAGLGSSVRILDEDRPEILHAAQNRGGPGYWNYGEQFSPRWQAARAFKFLRFIHYISEAFSDANQVEVEVRFNGLTGREIKNPTIGSYSYPRVALESERTLALKFPLSRLSSIVGTSDVTAELLNPVFRLFEGFEIGSDYAQSVFKR
ncbi:MAG: ATP-binding protein [Pseudomonadota bacterium]